eukprot:968319-Rhodomonas_salina.1
MTLTELHKHTRPPEPERCHTSPQDEQWIRSLVGIDAIVAVNLEHQVALARFHNPPCDSDSPLHRLTDTQLARVLCEVQATITVPDDTRFWHNESPGVHRVRVFKATKLDGRCQLHTVIIQAPHLGEIGSVVQPILISANKGSPSIHMMLKGDRLPEV